MKKKSTIIISLILVMIVCLMSGCASSVNNEISSKIERTMNNLNATIKKIETISDDDLIVSDIMPSRTTNQMTLPQNFGNTANKQIVNYNDSEIPSNQTTENYNTFGGFNQTNNVNTFANPNMFNQYGYPPYFYNGMPTNQLGNNFYYNNGYGPNNNNFINYPNRFISNVNTYRMGATNVNTYKNANAQNSNQQLQTYFSKLSNLYGVASNVVNTNDNINNIKNSVLAKISSIKTLASQIKNKEEFNENKIKSITTLLDNVNTYINKLNFSRNDVKTELNSVRRLKNNYTNNVEQLSSKYLRLTNCLDSRYAYYNNILNCLLGLEDCLCGTCNFDCFSNNCTNNQTCPNDTCPDDLQYCPNNQQNSDDIQQNNLQEIKANTKLDKKNLSDLENSDIKDASHIIKNQTISKNTNNISTFPAHPKKDDYLNSKVNKIDPFLYPKKDDPYRIMPQMQENKKNISEKKIYKFVENNEEKQNVEENSDTIQTGKILILTYYA